jgi:hypothetical protein
MRVLECSIRRSDLKFALSGPWPAGDLDFWDPSCPAPMREYIWLDWVVS